MCERERVCERESVCVCERETVCVRESVCVCVREREREKKSLHVENEFLCQILAAIWYATDRFFFINEEDKLP